ncbi:MAG: adenosylcobinamide-phosphate synthase CbiB [Ramlibacter sp.]
MSFTSAVIALLAALAIDRWWGEPRARLHPVVWMGHYLVWAGRRIAPGVPHQGTDWRAFWAGGLAWSMGVWVVLLVSHVLVGLSLALPLLLPTELEWLWHGVTGLVLGLLLKPLLAWRMLHDEVAAVEAALAESLDAGRAQLARLVSRDVTQLTESEVRESAIESLAENLNDSVVAPVFWFVLLGLPGAAVYRFANTADAMWGYRGLRGGRYWEWAGKWAARADDVLSWVPARITALLLVLAGGGQRLAGLRQEARRTPSPNSGWPMAAMALALDVRLGKPGVYVLYGAGRAPRAADTQRAKALAQRAVIALVLLAVPALLAVLGSPA